MSSSMKWNFPGEYLFKSFSYLQGNSTALKSVVVFFFNRFLFVYLNSFFFQKVASYFDDSMWVAPSGVVLVVMFVWLSTAVSPPPYSTARTSMRIVSILFPMNEALNVSTPDRKSTSSYRHTQWRIQDFPITASTYCLANFLPKIPWKWKNLDRRGGGASPTLGSAIDTFTRPWGRLTFISRITISSSIEASTI